MVIHIVNFEKYNPRKDYQTRPWIRVESKLPFDPKFHDISAQGMWLWVMLLCIAGVENNDNIIVDIKWISLISKIEVDDIKMILQKFQEKQLLTCDDIKSGGQKKSAGPTNKQTNKQTIDIIFDFDAAYQEYPRKIGKKKGFEILKRVIKTEKQYSDFCAAIKNYAMYCKRERVEEKYIKHFSTFVNQFEDWVNMPGSQNRTLRDGILHNTFDSTKIPGK